MLQDSTSGNKIKENKYKILRMSLLLGNGEDREDTINNFEDAAKDIDAMNDEIYLKDLEGKFYDTLTLEEEEKKLSILVDYIGGRVEQRLSLLSDFSNVTGFELTNLAPVKYYDKLDEYKERLSYIREYLDNIKKINSLKGEISELEDRLNDTYVKKAKAEEKNVKDEKELLNKFENILKKIDIFKDINLENVESKLNDVISLVQDSKKSLDIFDKSYATLTNAGISGAEQEEYLSYVNSARDAYYKNKEEEYLIRLYMLFNTSESEYSKLLVKRDEINKIIYDRLDLRRDLDIDDFDNLSSIYDILERQYEDINKQKKNIEDIDILTNDINIKRNEVNELELDNQKVEILSLLKEFCIIDTYDGVEENKLTEVNEEDCNDKVEVAGSSDIFSVNGSNKELENSVDDIGDVVNNDNNSVSVKDDIIEIKDAKDNQVVSVKDASSINIDDAVLKSNNVMKRVGEMLGVKVEDVKIVSVDSTDNITNQPNNQNEEKISDNVVKDNPILEDGNVNNSKDIVDNSEDNIFISNTFDADPETNDAGLNGSDSLFENPLFSNSLGSSTLDDVMAKNDAVDGNMSNSDFWFPNEERPLDLNSLPDLSSNDDSFFNTNTTNNNSMPELNFPDLDVNFDDGEAK